MIVQYDDLSGNVGERSPAEDASSRNHKRSHASEGCVRGVRPCRGSGQRPTGDGPPGRWLCRSSMTMGRSSPPRDVILHPPRPPPRADLLQLMWKIMWYRKSSFFSCKCSTNLLGLMHISASYLIYFETTVYSKLAATDLLTFRRGKKIS
jgi:hypothetical protein